MRILPTPRPSRTLRSKAHRQAVAPAATGPVLPEFLMDSLLEEPGFEPLVPLCGVVVSGWNRNAGIGGEDDLEGVFCRGDRAFESHLRQRRVIGVDCRAANRVPAPFPSEYGNVRNRRRPAATPAVDECEGLPLFGPCPKACQAAGSALPRKPVRKSVKSQPSLIQIP